MRPLRNSDFPDGWDDLRALQHFASPLVLRHVFDGFDSLRHFGKADSTRNRSDLQNRLAYVPPDSLSLLSESEMQLEGSAVEIDETYVGGKRKNRHGSRGMRGRDNDEKTPVFGMVERGGKGRVLAYVTPDAKAATLFPIIEEKILPNSIVYSDEYSTYDKLATPANGYDHRRIKHAQKIYVMGDVHTQTIEGFWSLIKRGIGGVYHSVSRKYLQTYLDEYSFRYNRRDQGNLIFNAFLKRVVERAGLPPVAAKRQMTPLIQEPF
jgi:transposase-like protein